MSRHWEVINVHVTGSTIPGERDVLAAFDAAFTGLSLKVTFGIGPEPSCTGDAEGVEAETRLAGTFFDERVLWADIVRTELGIKVSRSTLGGCEL